MLLLFRWLRQDMQRLEARTGAMEHRLSARFDANHVHIDSLTSLFTCPGSTA